MFSLLGGKKIKGEGVWLTEDCHYDVELAQVKNGHLGVFVGLRDSVPLVLSLEEGIKH